MKESEGNKESFKKDVQVQAYKKLDSKVVLEIEI